MHACYRQHGAPRPTYLSPSLNLPPSLTLSLLLSYSAVADNQYKYVYQLLQLEARSIDRKEPLSDYLCHVVTPLKLEAWQRALSYYPDQTFAAYISRGIEKGFRIGFNPQLVELQSSGSNMSSASEQSDVVERYLQEELAANRIIRVQDADAGVAARLE